MEMLVQDRSKSAHGLPSKTVAVAICLFATSLSADVASIRAALQAGRFVEAIAACDQELKTTPKNAALLTLKGLALQASGNPTASLSSFRQALIAAPSYLPALQAAAQIEFDTRDARARPTLEAILKLASTNETAHSMLGELAFEARDCPRALDHFSKIASGARRPLARWQHGVCLFERERWREAASEFQALLGIREHPPTRFNLALSHWHAKNFAAALDALAPLSAPDADALSLKALVLRERNEIPQALEVLQGAVAAYPGDERLLLDLALLCLDQNSVELGTAVLEAGLSRLPRSVRLLTALGVFQVRAGDMKRAEEYFLAAEQLAPQSGLGQVAAATAMIQLGLPDDAIRRLQTISVPSPMVSLTLARALLQKGGLPQHRAEAKRLLASVVAREPNNSVAHSLLGKTLAQDGEVSRATQALEIAFRLDPSDRTAAYQLMLLYRRVGKTAQASLLNTQLRQTLAKENADILEAPRYQLSRSPGQ